jgi:hypothetical protein
VKAGKAFFGEARRGSERRGRWACVRASGRCTFTR